MASVEPSHPSQNPPCLCWCPLPYSSPHPHLCACLLQDNSGISTFEFLNSGTVSCLKSHLVGGCPLLDPESACKNYFLPAAGLVVTAGPAGSHTQGEANILHDLLRSYSVRGTDWAMLRLRLVDVSRL
jgi:hypothetical protein